MAFRSVATLCSTLFVFIALAFFALPGVITAAWGLQLEGEAAFMGQRYAAAFAGMAVVLYLARDAGPSVARRAIAFGIGAFLILVACVGLLALVQGRVAGGILMAVAVELILAGALILTGRQAV